MTAWMFQAAKEERGPRLWRLPVLAIGAGLALVVESATYVVLDRRAESVAEDLFQRAEEDLVRLTPARVPGAEDAAELYATIESSYCALGDGDVLGEWEEVLSGEASLVLESSELAELRASLAPILEEARKAARIERCSFGLGPEDERLADPARFWVLRRVVDGLVLDARVRAAKGDIDGAFDDLHAALGIARHFGSSSGLGSLVSAAISRSSAVAAVGEVLVRDGLTTTHVNRIAPAIEAAAREPFREVLPHAVALDTAEGLRHFGRMATRRVTDEEATLGSAFGVPDSLYRVFLLERDVSAFRRVMLEANSVATSSLQDAVAYDAERRTRIHAMRSGGLLTRSLGSPISGQIVFVQAMDAQARLAELALAAARHRIANGRYPTTLEELEVGTTDVRIDGDGTWVLFTDTTAGFDEPPTLRMPPETAGSKAR